MSNTGVTWESSHSRQALPAESLLRWRLRDCADCAVALQTFQDLGSEECPVCQTLLPVEMQEMLRREMVEASESDRARAAAPPQRTKRLRTVESPGSASAPGGLPDSGTNTPPAAGQYLSMSDGSYYPRATTSADGPPQQPPEAIDDMDTVEGGVSVPVPDSGESEGEGELPIWKDDAETADEMDLRSFT